MKRDLRKECVQLLYRQSGSTQASAVAIASIYLYTFKDDIPTGWIGIWASAFSLILVARVGLSKVFAKGSPLNQPGSNPKFWEKIFAFGAFLSGLCWGVAASVFLASAAFSHFAMMGFILAGVTAGASVAYSTSLLTTQAFFASSVLPYMAMLILQGTQLHSHMAAMVGCYAVFYYLQSLRIHRISIASIKLSLEKDSLLERARRSASELSKSRENLKAAQRIAHVGSTSMDVKTGKLYWSEEVFRILELDPARDVPSLDLFFSLIHPDDRVHAKKEINEFIGSFAESGGSFIGDRRILTRNGNLKFISTRAEPEFGPSGKVVSLNGVVLDVTDRKKSELAVAQNFKLSALVEMAGGTAHEINSPLTAIKLAASVMIDQLQNDAPDMGFLIKLGKKIEDVSDKIAKIISSLRYFSKGGTTSPLEQMPLRQLLQGALDPILQKMQLAQVRIEYDIEEGTEITCRPIDVSHVFQNLVHNSIDAIADLPEKWIRISAKKVEGFVEIRVTDSGAGIPEIIASKLYQPFFTTKGFGKGTGLGLSLSRGIVEAHQGKLSLDLLSRNTCFIVLFPDRRIQPEVKAA